MFLEFSKKYIVLGLAGLGVLAYLIVTDFKVFRNPTVINHPIVTQPPSNNGELDFLSLPENLAISVFSEGLENPRVIAFDPIGRMIVSETRAGRISRLDDVDKDGKSDNKITVLS